MEHHRNSSQGIAKLGYTEHACMKIMNDVTIRQPLIRQSEKRGVPGKKDQCQGKDPTRTQPLPPPHLLHTHTNEMVGIPEGPTVVQVSR